jgi:hypothetical protein
MQYLSTKEIKQRAALIKAKGISQAEIAKNLKPPRHPSQITGAINGLQPTVWAEILKYLEEVKP